MTAGTTESRARDVAPGRVVIASDVIFDLVFARDDGRGEEAARLFDVLAAHRHAGRDERLAYVAPMTLDTVYHLSAEKVGTTYARAIIRDLLSVVDVVPLTALEYSQAIDQFGKYELEHALLFVACRRVGARYVVTRAKFGVKRMQVQRRTAAQALPLLRVTIRETSSIA